MVLECNFGDASAACCVAVANLVESLDTQIALEIFVVLRKGLNIYPRLASNSFSSLLSLLSATITGAYPPHPVSSHVLTGVGT